jgi:4-aminobutyrate aminotransferase-like enzyme
MPDLCERNNVASIVDETLTSGWVSGRPFMYQSWNSEKTPDFVTFASRMQIAGYLFKEQFKPKLPYQIMSTWQGDPFKIIQFKMLQNYIRNVDWLDAHAAQFIQSVKAELFDVQRRVDFKIENIRGIGKIFGFDVENELMRDEIMIDARKNGFRLNPLGKKTVGFTPSLMFAEVHFAHFKEYLLKFKPNNLI